MYLVVRKVYTKIWKYRFRMKFLAFLETVNQEFQPSCRYFQGCKTPCNANN